MSDHTDTTLTDTEYNDLRAAFERDKWAGEWNSLPTAVDRVVAARVAAARANERARIITNLYKHSARLTSTFGPGTAAFDLGRYTEGAWFACVAEWIEGADQ